MGITCYKKHYLNDYVIPGELGGDGRRFRMNVIEVIRTEVAIIINWARLRYNWDGPVDR